MPFDRLDYIILAGLGFSMLVGLYRGFIRVAFALVSWVAAVWFAIVWGPEVGDAFFSGVAGPPLTYIGGFALLCIAGLILARIMGFLLSKIVKKTGLGLGDRLLGVIFGGARATLGVLFMIFVANFVQPEDNPVWQESVLLPYFQVLADKLEPVLPQAYESLLG